MNGHEKKLREAWAGASETARNWFAVVDEGRNIYGICSAVRAFCESEPSAAVLVAGDGTLWADDRRITAAAPAVVEPEALRKVREAWAGHSAKAKARALRGFRGASGYRPSDELFRALADLLESAPVEGGETQRALFADLQRALVAEDERDKLRAKLAAAEKERDEARSETNIMRTQLRDQSDMCNKAASRRDYLRDCLQRAENARDEAISHIAQFQDIARQRDAAKREAEAMRAEQGGMRAMADASNRSYKAQLADLQRALTEEKKAHNEALARAWLAAPLSAPDAPDEYTRAAVEFAEASVDDRVSYSNFEPIEDAWKALYDARQRGEPSAPVSSPPPARVLECWVLQYHGASARIVIGDIEAARKIGTHAECFHRVALPVIETVERGA
jgi:hypothetical protein